MPYKGMGTLVAAQAPSRSGLILSMTKPQPCNVPIVEYTLIAWRSAIQLNKALRSVARALIRPEALQACQADLARGPNLTRGTRGDGWLFATLVGFIPAHDERITCLADMADDLIWLGSWAEPLLGVPLDSGAGGAMSP